MRWKSLGDRFKESCKRRDAGRDWHRWFAWYPVKVEFPLDDGTIKFETVWLETVWRKIHEARYHHTFHFESPVRRYQEKQYSIIKPTIQQQQEVSENG